MKVNTDTVLNTVTDEDLALDAELERLAKAEPEILSEGSNLNQVKVIREENVNPLSDFVEGYKPARTVEQLDAQVWQAKSHAADSIEAEDDVFKRLLGPNAQDECMIYKNVRVYRVGMRDEVLRKESLSIEAKVFGKAK